jgi:hypothetical protein
MAETQSDTQPKVTNQEQQTETETTANSIANVAKEEDKRISITRSRGFNLIPEIFYQKKKRKLLVGDVNIYGAAGVFILIAITAALVGTKQYVEITMKPTKEEVVSLWTDVSSRKEVEQKAVLVENRLDTLEELQVENQEVFELIDIVENSVTVDFAWISIETTNQYVLTAKLSTFEAACKYSLEIAQISGLNNVWADEVRVVPSRGDLEGYAIARVTFTK